MQPNLFKRLKRADVLPDYGGWSSGQSHPQPLTTRLIIVYITDRRFQKEKKLFLFCISVQKFEYFITVIIYYTQSWIEILLVKHQDGARVVG